jgi:S-adenosylmethionine hydrolase
LSNYDLLFYAKLLALRNFAGVFMRDNLPSKIKNNEKAIVNLGSVYSNGTHWVAYKKTGNKISYFDSFGNLRPPLELIRYFNSDGHVLINYNFDKKQEMNSVNCGHLCLAFLSNVLV